MFDSIDHEILLNLTKRKVDDERFIKLINRFLKSGYLEDWTYHNTFSGTPQGGILSPLLANIYLHELDNFMRELADKWNAKGKMNSKYQRIYSRMYRRRRKMIIARKAGKDKEVEKLKKQIEELDRKIENLPARKSWKRINYCRYADDFIVGILGSKQEAKLIKDRIAQFLNSKLKLELSQKKTLITYSQDKARFLGYEIGVVPPHRNVPLRGQRGNILLYMPKEKIREQCRQFRKGRKSIHLPQLRNQSDKEILLHYDSKLRGWYNYWKMAENVCEMNKVYWFAQSSFFKTMADKYKSTIGKVIDKYYDKADKQVVVKAKVKDKVREYKMLKSFRKDNRPLRDWKIDSKLNIKYFPDGVEIKRRIQTNRCELCGRKTDKIIAHHVRRLADIRGNEDMEKWKKVMIAKNRKSLMVCKTCHNRIHRNN